MTLVIGGSVGAEELVEVGIPSNGEAESSACGDSLLLRGENDCCWSGMGEVGFEVPLRWKRKWESMMRALVVSPGAQRTAGFERSNQSTRLMCLRLSEDGSAPSEERFLNATETSMAMEVHCTHSTVVFWTIEVGPDG